MRRQNSTSSKSEIIKEIIKAGEGRRIDVEGHVLSGWLGEDFSFFSFCFPKMMKCGNKFFVRLGKAQ